MFFEIEGIDGTGKTTQCWLLKEYFYSLGLDSLIIKELDSTEFSREVKKILTSNSAKDARAEMFLFLSCKCQVFSQLIRPSLESGLHIISDRGLGSFMSYNSSILNLELSKLRDLLEFCSLDYKPDLTFLLDIPGEAARERIFQKNEQTRFDLVSMDILTRQREKFLEIAALSPSWLVIDGLKSIKSIQNIIRKQVEKRLPSKV